MNSSRRHFLQRYSVAGLSLALAPSLSSMNLERGARELLIVHTNDMHSHIDPFSIDHPKYPGQGGMAYRAEMISRIRKEHGEILLVDSGDILQGTPYFNLFGGELEMKLMSLMGYDAATMGNHDFDAGMDGFLKAKAHADFPFLCSNYDMSDTPLAGHTIGHRVFKKNGIRIGVFGLGIDPKGLIPPSLCRGVIYQNPISIAQAKVEQLRMEERCDLVICLSHLGLRYEQQGKMSDVVLAESVDGIDLILGGHTHSFMEGLLQVQHLRGHVTHIHQVGWAGVRLGLVSITLHKKGKHTEIQANASWINGSKA